MCLRLTLFALLFSSLSVFSSSAFSFDKIEFFKAAHETVAELERNGQLEGETPELIFKMALASKEIELTCHDLPFDKLTPSCIKPECASDMCPKVGAGAIIRWGAIWLGGYYANRIADDVIRRSEGRIADWHERGMRETRERVARERRENERNERCATAATGSGLGYGCGH